jgi:glucose-1-phosphate thymidylyltransferase
MKQAVILAAGEGQRLRPFTVNKPKAMITLADKPILQYVIEALAQNGIRDIVLVVGYRKEQVFDYLGSGKQFGVDIRYVTQEKQLGTAHALAQAKDVLEKEFLVLYGDNVIKAETIASFINAAPEAILVKKIVSQVRYQVVTINEGMLTDMAEQPKETGSNMIDTGVYAFNKDILGFIEEELDIPDALLNMVAEGYHISTVETDGTWLDVVYPWDILSLNEVVLPQKPDNLGGIIEPGVSITKMVSVGNGTVVRANSYIAGPAVIGAGCEIGPSVCIMPATSIGNNVVIAPFTEIRNCVIGDDVNIGAGSIIQDSVIDRSCVIKGQFTASSDEAEVKINGEYHVVNVGAMLGEGCHVGSNVVAQPGVIVGNYSQIKALKLVSGRLPDKSVVF